MNIKKKLSLLLCLIIIVPQLQLVAQKQNISRKNNLNSLITLCGAFISGIAIAKILQKISISDKPNDEVSKLKFIGASVIPFVQTPKGKFVLLSREVGGRDKGTFDAFGGKRDSGENNPIVTAAREFAEESMFKIFPNESEARKYIEINSGNTTNIVVNQNGTFVMYFTKFDNKKLDDFANNFHKNRDELIAKRAPRKLREKDKVAWIKLSKLANVVRSAKRNSNGKLIRPIQIKADVVQADGLKKIEKINLRPCLVNSTQPFFKGI